ncbi:MAG: efflux RND transporter periplasmic adaptor subunit [Proteobacteria bacterium]|nr:efflux RND transporter periplasmic adaptor subunit [Pseudomonadota bacterium]
MSRKVVITLLLAVCLPALAATAWWYWPIRVSTAMPARGPAIDAVYATGTVEPTVQMPVAPRSGGRLLAIGAEAATTRAFRCRHRRLL